MNSLLGRNTYMAVRRHPLISFFMLFYALAWIIESPLVFLRDTITAGDPPSVVHP